MTLSPRQGSLSHYQIGLQLGKKRKERSTAFIHQRNYPLLGPPDYHGKRGTEGNTSRKQMQQPSLLPCLPGAGPLCPIPFTPQQATVDPCPALGHSASSSFAGLQME